MDLIKIEYIEVGIMAACVLLIMLFYSTTTHYDMHKEEQKFFQRMALCNLVILCMDIWIYLLRGKTDWYQVGMTHAACVIFFSLHGVFAYNWLRYTVARLYPEYVLPGKKKGILLIPCLLNVGMAVLSPRTQWLYSLSEENHYVRGNYMMFSIFLTTVYWIFSCLLVVREMIGKRRIREKELYITLLLFPLPVLAANVIQLRIYGISIVWVCSAISLLALFLNLQSDQISRDTLTGLFNRKQTDVQMQWEIRHWQKMDDYFFVMMIDVDYFKDINDIYGHVEGDRALIRIAQILRASFSERDFIGRFGGDEFIVMGHVKEKSQVEAYRDNIQRQLERYNASAQKDPDGGKTYRLSMSAGYRIYDREETLTEDRLIAAADEEMYRIKKQRKQPS